MKFELSRRGASTERSPHGVGGPSRSSCLPGYHRRPLDFRASEQRCFGLKLSTLLVATTSTTRQPTVLSLNSTSLLNCLVYIAVFCAQPPLLRELGVTVASLLWAFFHKLFALEVAVGSTPASPPFVLLYETVRCTWCLPFAWSAAPSTVGHPVYRSSLVDAKLRARARAHSVNAAAALPFRPFPSQISCYSSSPSSFVHLPYQPCAGSIECRLTQPGPACLP